MKYAIIDISSSSISLLVAEGKKTFDVLLRERENVSILHYMEGKNLSERGVEKLVENLNKMKSVCRKMEIDKCYVISTASMRNFENFEWVLSELKRRAAVSVNLLDGQEEAYCDLISNEGYRALDRAVLTDIGGGSIELCDLTQNNPDALVYLDFGPIQLNRRFVENIHPTEEEAKDIKKFVRKKLEKSGLPGDSAFSTAVLVGATNQAIYDVYCDYYDAEKEGEKRIEYDRLKKLCKHLVRSSDRSMLVLKNAPEKIYTLTTAAVILRAMLKYFGVSNIVVSDFGVKEGYLALVTDGRWEGTETDLGEVPAAETAVLSLPGEPSAKKKKKAKKAAETAEESKADTKETDSSQPAPAAKRRGRPRKTAPAAAETDKAATVKKENKAEVPALAETPAKRRGRPRKTPAPAGVSEPEKAAEIPAESPAKAPARKRAAKRATKTSGTAETEKTAEAIVTPEEIAVQPEEKTAAVSSETAVKAPAAAPRRSRAKKAAATTAKRRAVKKAAVEKAAGAQPEAATETQPESVPEPGKPADSEETQKTENVPENVEVGTIEAATAAASENPAAESAATDGETAAENAEMAAEGVLKAGEGVKEGES
ncbi:MAG TPA: hypothetical protein IAC57_01645 [Candidatus Scatosoma pullistercoris]|uniref:Ppx/GppA phosphatase N-terminal domain-containing protein n=1 Tax=Candidatus Scatosoma pullistercoris TaxID=2840934 RepID=A0A9D1MEV7_9FIRM|nr:hypothetical protein [Candidatus Scatosoma pullistercoris]